MDNMPPCALVIEDDRSWQQILHELLVDAGVKVDLVDNLPAAREVISERSHRLAVIDLSLSGADHSNQDGLLAMDYLKKHDPDCVTILLTGYATVEIAVSVLSDKGAFTCLRKEQFQRSEFKELIKRVLSLPVNSFRSFKIGREQKQTDEKIDTSTRNESSVLVVEDDAGWRDIFYEILSDAGFHVSLCCSYGEALGYLKRDKCDIAVIDLSLEGKSTFPEHRLENFPSNFEGYHLLSAIKTETIPAIVVSGEATIQDINAAYNEQNIYAFFEKQTFDRNHFIDTVAQAALSQTNRSPVHKLTSRELEVLELLTRGLTNKEIAEHLVITPNTVKRHLKAIFEKLDIHTRSSAAVIGANWFGPEIVESVD